MPSSRRRSRSAAATASATIAVPATETSQTVRVANRAVVTNLLDNALTYNHPGGSVRLSVYRADGVHLEVGNTGPLLDPATAHRLFEPFYRPQGRVHRDGHGHGLGLAIVDSIATAHHGTATATAHPAGGLTVTVELPRTQPAEREPELTYRQPVSPKVSRSS
ncbi:sensor histidine kinase [Kitasatospora sp. NPDC101801]|uniref:sensor histidine kinase n=1 Tax=Kitasatospora sp. NPDC101801 TaxID=3364103 RepID=UPI00380A7541